MAHFASHTIARMEYSERVNRKVADLSANLEHKKAVMQNRLALAKLEARQDIEARIAKRVDDLSNEKTMKFIRAQFQRNKDSSIAGYAMLTQMALFCAYITAVLKYL
jgi:Zn-dependent M16 (insulinase) family peptidase